MENFDFVVSHTMTEVVELLIAFSCTITVARGLLYQVDAKGIFTRNLIQEKYYQEKLSTII
jgi:hypothetical protein